MKTSLSSLIVVSLLLAVSAAAAEDKTPIPFAYTAPAFIKELDTRYPAQPPVPPSPPRYGGVLHFPATVRAFDPPSVIVPSWRSSGTRSPSGKQPGTFPRFSASR